MKKLVTLSASLFFAVVSLAQCNDAFFPFKIGSSFEQISYDADGKEQGKSVSEIKNIAGSEAIVLNTFFDRKGKQVAKGDYKVVCEDGITKLDFNNFIPEEMLNQYGEDAKVSVIGDFISLPNALTVGQNLPNSEGEIEVNMSGANIQIKMDMLITERFVEKIEPVVTPAGSFDSYKITQKTVIEMDMMGTKNTVQTSSASWFAKNIGMVKTESYDNRGEVNGYTLLTAINN